MSLSPSDVAVATKSPTINARPPLILASSSRYRRELLERLRLPFTIARPDIDETPLPGEGPVATARRLSHEKAQAIATKCAGTEPGALVIGSDQVATLDGEQIGKPGSHAKALAQLQHMRGRTVLFHSALCLYDARTDTFQEDCATVSVQFRTLSDEVLENYLHIEQPYDVAGSAKSEGLGIALIARIDNDDPSALVGLPLIRLVSMLAHAGYPVIPVANT